MSPLAPTLTLMTAAGRDWGAVVVGAGPAGSLAAFHLARRGIATLLVERATLPRWKVCGCCLGPRALVVLERAGLGSLLRDQGAVPLISLILGAGSRIGTIPLSGGVSLSREALDTALARAAVEAGAHFLPETRAALDSVVSCQLSVVSQRSPQLTTCGKALWLHQGSGSVRIQARVVLAADGLGGQLLARAGVTEAPPEAGARIGAAVTLPPCQEATGHYEPGTVYMACGRGGYVGLVRLEDGRLDCAAAFDAGAVRAAHGPGALAVRILEEVGWPVPAHLDEQPWKGTPPLTRTARHLASHRVFVLGDAAGYVEPFTGEGISWALASAEALAPLAARAVQRWDDALLAAWAKRHARIVTRRQWACRATAALLRRPRLTRAVVTVLGWAPILAAPVVRFLATPTELMSEEC
jgi:flavin-dependent dehydrogenase